ncbi:YceI family protein [Streptomyces sp. NPDC057381]|uniref:YceI family protein n=1 Tax=Streptomyces sp. NPDC057381 TaxID=3346111 RepID=UPI0036277377
MLRDTGAVEPPRYPVGTWKADPTHSEIAFSIRQLAGTVRGRFTDYDITLVTREDPTRSSVTASIDLMSIDTGNARRDKHLRTADLAGAARFPTMSYHSVGISRSDGRWTVDGELTLKGVTCRMPLAMEPADSDPDSDSDSDSDSAGNFARFSARAQLHRRDFGIGIPMDVGGIVVSGKISVSLTVHAVLQE